MQWQAWLAAHARRALRCLSSAPDTCTPNLRPIPQVTPPAAHAVCSMPARRRITALFAAIPAERQWLAGQWSPHWSQGGVGNKADF
jgi:hypothetical protein